MIEIILKNHVFKNNNYQIQEYFESLKYQVSISNDQINCKPTFFKKISSGGSFWMIDYFLIEFARNETVIKVKLSKINSIVIFLLYLIAMLGFYMHEGMTLSAMIGYFGILLIMYALLTFLSVSELKKEIKSFSDYYKK